MEELLKLMMSGGGQVGAPNARVPGYFNESGFANNDLSLSGDPRFSPFPMQAREPGMLVPESEASPGMLPRTVTHNGMDIQLPPAEYEDSSNAYWDAQRMGNGAGHSFYDVEGVAHYGDQSGAGSRFTPEQQQLLLMLMQGQLVPPQR